MSIYYLQLPQQYIITRNNNGLTLDTQNNRTHFHNQPTRHSEKWDSLRSPQIENKQNKSSLHFRSFVCLGTGKGGKCSSLAANINCLSACTCYSESSPAASQELQHFNDLNILCNIDLSCVLCITPELVRLGNKLPDEVWAECCDEMRLGKVGELLSPHCLVPASNLVWRQQGQSFYWEHLLPIFICEASGLW